MQKMKNIRFLYDYIPGKREISSGLKLCDGTETNLRLTISTNLQLLALISIESIILIYNLPSAAVSPEGCDL